MTSLVTSAQATLSVPLRWRPSIKDAAELLLIAAALPIYYLVRGITQTQVEDAVARGVDIIQVEQSLGIFWEVEMQGAILSYEWLVKFLNNYYLFGHLPVIGLGAIWLYFWHRRQYALMRNAFLLSGAIALIFYVSFPTAPPRLLPEHLGYGFVDTVVDQYQASRPLTPSWFVNEYAAFPSMHIGWNLLVGIAIFMATKNVFIRAFAVVMPLLMFLDIVLTANHYFLDAAAGLVVMFTGLAIALAVRTLAERAVPPGDPSISRRPWVGWLHWAAGVTNPAAGQPTWQTG
jgi:hypothetical protein